MILIDLKIHTSIWGEASTSTRYIRRFGAPTTTHALKWMHLLALLLLHRLHNNPMLHQVAQRLSKGHVSADCTAVLFYQICEAKNHVAVTRKSAFGTGSYNLY